MRTRLIFSVSFNFFLSFFLPHFTASDFIQQKSLRIVDWVLGIGENFGIPGMEPSVPHISRVLCVAPLHYYNTVILQWPPG